MPKMSRACYGPAAVVFILLSLRASPSGGAEFAPISSPSPFTTTTSPISNPPPLRPPLSPTIANTSLTSSPPPSLPGKRLQVRWCCVGRDELAFCQTHVPYLSKGDSLIWSCLGRSTPVECMLAIGSGKAELINLEAGLAYRAFTRFRMKAIMAERLVNGLSYEAVAVVNREQCQGNTRLMLQDLKGTRSCHGYYHSSAGWDLPLQAMSAAGVPPPPKTQWDGSAGAAGGAGAGAGVPIPPKDVTYMESFFTTSCAPGFGTDIRICSGCHDESKQGPCNAADPYAGPVGSFRCLLEGAGDVAFTRTPVVTKYSLGGRLQMPWSIIPAAEYQRSYTGYKREFGFRFLCPSGGCVDISDNPGFFNCTLGSVPSNVIMTRNAISEADKLAIIARLEEAGGIPDWREAVYQGTNHYEYLLTCSAVGLVRVEGLTRAFLGSAGVDAAAIDVFNDALGKGGNQSEASAASNTRCVSSWLIAFVCIILPFFIR